MSYAVPPLSVVTSRCVTGAATNASGSTRAQTVTVQSGQTHLTFWYENLSPDIVSLDWFTVMLRDNGTKNTTTLVPAHL